MPDSQALATPLNQDPVRAKKEKKKFGRFRGKKKKKVRLAVETPAAIHYFRNPVVPYLPPPGPSLFFSPFFNHQFNPKPPDNEVALATEYSNRTVRYPYQTSSRSCRPLSLSCKRPLRGCLIEAPLQSSSPSRHSILSAFDEVIPQAFTVQSPPEGTVLAH